MMNAEAFAGTVSTTLHQGIGKFMQVWRLWWVYWRALLVNPLSLHQWADM